MGVLTLLSCSVQTSCDSQLRSVTQTPESPLHCACVTYIPVPLRLLLALAPYLSPSPGKCILVSISQTPVAVQAGSQAGGGYSHMMSARV